MQKRAFVIQTSAPKTVFAPLPAASDSAVYYDQEPITLSYSEHFSTLHFHDRYEIGFCEEGEGLLCAEGIFSTFAQGDILFVSPNQYHYAHSLQTNQPCRLRFYYILPYALSSLLKNNIPPNTNRIPSVLRKNEYPQSVATLLGILHHGSLSESKEAAILLRVATFLTEAEQIFPSTIESPPAPNPHKRSGEATQLAQFLSVHYRESISAAELSALFHLSESQMRRKFVAQYGMPPIAYRNALRCKIGAKLLVRTNFSISEIAERIGYSTPADFYRSFLGEYGVSPSDYRKKKKEN